MLQARRHFHRELVLLEEDVLQLGERAAKALEKAMRALVHRDGGVVNEVIEGDDELDEMYVDIEQRILSLLATQTPVASDLRLISAILHSNLHLERVGDMAVNIAKVTSATMDLPRSDTVLSHLQEMGNLVLKMLRVALDAFSLRDAALAEKLPDMDEPVDRLNRNMYREVVALAHDQGLLDWGIRMNMVSRQLERVGDHAVDIGEQVAFLLTGEFREFTDASHPTAAE
ncbi:MAG: phosphate signaling complex protein PhoU [Actinomycetota bacterium]|nr:phosphate signaling complex protein PhoU [Actinomycetota bacterium]